MEIIIGLMIAAAVIGAWLAAIDLFIQVGVKKGYTMDNKGFLWYIGIFATPLAVGLYVASLPDKSNSPEKESSVSKGVPDDLPAL